MNKKILSRYGEPRYLTDHGGGWFTIEGKSKFYRVGGTPNELSYLDFEGGPFLSIDSNYPEFGGTIQELIMEPTEEGFFKVRFRTEN
jgi:hypothetical protein